MMVDEISIADGVTRTDKELNNAFKRLAERERR